MKKPEVLKVPDEVLKRGCYSDYRVLKGLTGLKKKRDKSNKNEDKKKER